MAGITGMRACGPEMHEQALRSYRRYWRYSRRNELIFGQVMSGQTLREVAALHGVSVERVRQICSQIWRQANRRSCGRIRPVTA